MNESIKTTHRFSWREALLSSPAVAVGVFCVGLLTCTGVALAVIATQAAKGSSSLDVTGVSSQLITSDRVRWSFQLKTTSINRIEGAKKQQIQLEKTLAFLKTNQVSEGDISIKVLTIRPNIDRNPENGRSTLVSWDFSQEVVILSADVEKIAEVSQRSSELISAGVDARFNMPEYTYSGIAEKRVELLEGATENAKQRALAIASTGDASLGQMTYVGTAVFQVTTPGSSSTGESGVYNTESIDKEINAVMAVRFRIN